MELMVVTPYVGNLDEEVTRKRTDSIWFAHLNVKKLEFQCEKISSVWENGLF